MPPLLTNASYNVIMCLKVSMGVCHYGLGHTLRSKGALADTKVQLQKLAWLIMGVLHS